MSRTALVVASNRPQELAQFLAHWSGQSNNPWHDVIVVADGPRDEWARVADLFSAAEHVFYWEDHQELAGARSWIFSRCDSAIKCFGFLKAIQRGARHVIVMDDDCRPHARYARYTGDGFPMEPDVRQFIIDHVNLVDTPPGWVSTVPGMRVRGLPYRDWMRPIASRENLVNMGLWAGVPDLDAVTTLAGAIEEVHYPWRGISRGPRFNPPRGWTQIMPPDQYWPFCGMNFCFKAEALPALYFPKMGEGSPYSRFDDIWCGVLMQKLFRHCGYSASVGEPFVEHIRSSETLVNLRKEAPGIEMHESFWRIIDGLDLTWNPSLLDCVRQAGVELASRSYRALRQTERAYLQQWGQALQVWAELCNEVTPGPELPVADRAGPPPGPDPFASEDLGPGEASEPQAPPASP